MCGTIHSKTRTVKVFCAKKSTNTQKQVDICDAYVVLRAVGGSIPCCRERWLRDSVGGTVCASTALLRKDPGEIRGLRLRFAFSCKLNYGSLIVGLPGLEAGTSYQRRETLFCGFRSFAKYLQKPEFFPTYFSRHVSTFTRVAAQLLYADPAMLG